jgi:hypothetical protein
LIDGFECDGGLDGCGLHGEKGSTGAGFRGVVHGSMSEKARCRPEGVYVRTANSVPQRLKPYSFATIYRHD